MYKFLLVTDRQDILDFYAQIDNWERLGFKAPHIRHDFEGAKESLAKHHADAITFALDYEQTEQMITYLWEEYPLLSVFKTGSNKDEALFYLNELKSTLNLLRADYSNDDVDAAEVMLKFRHDLFRNMLAGNIHDKEYFHRQMRLLRSRMDPDRPCYVAELEAAIVNNGNSERLTTDEHYLLERTLKTSFTRDLEGYHIFPLVTKEGSIYIVAGPLHDSAKTGTVITEEAFRKVISESCEHVMTYRGMDLKLIDLERFVSFMSLCE